eukprot:157516_1
MGAIIIGLCAGESSEIWKKKKHTKYFICAFLLYALALLLDIALFVLAMIKLHNKTDRIVLGIVVGLLIAFHFIESALAAHDFTNKEELEDKEDVEMGNQS